MADKAAKKLVKDMHYKARIQAVIKYHAEIHRVSLPKCAGKNPEAGPRTIPEGKYRTLILIFSEINYA